MKHSPNLRRFLSKAQNKHYRHVYLKRLDDAGNPVTSWQPGLMYIGYADDSCIAGARLARILCGEFGTWAFPIGPSAVTDITDEFWKQYERDGRCTFDRDHSMFFQNDDDRYTVIGATRRCNWCGKWHTSHIRKHVTIKRIEEWEPTQ